MNTYDDNILQILIPTYNRSNFLLKNLEQLDEIVSETNSLRLISVIICDNASSDDTVQRVKDAISRLRINVALYTNDINIGLEKNALKVLEQATSKYIMYLGDDDFIDGRYLEKVLSLILEDKDTHCIVPAYYPIDLDGNKLKGGRDLKIGSYSLEKGYDSAVKIYLKGHQLSGLVLYREGLLDAYRDTAYRNIYLFMFFVGYCAINGRTYHITDYPVKVTQPGQNNKDWNYGKDGLVIERLKNTASLFKGNSKNRFLGEKELITNKTRVFFRKYQEMGFIKSFTFILVIFFSRFLSIPGKIYFLKYIFVISIWLKTKRIIKKLLSFLNKNHGKE